MRRPSPVWETEYKNDRRKHCHRCKCCNRIIKPGERVLMAYATRGTVAVHVEPCADMGKTDQGGMTYRERMHHWGLSGLKARGWRVPELDTHYP